MEPIAVEHQDTVTSLPLSSVASIDLHAYTHLSTALHTSKPTKCFEHTLKTQENESVQSKSSMMVISESLENEHTPMQNIYWNSTQTSELTHQLEAIATNEQQSSESISGKICFDCVILLLNIIPSDYIFTINMDRKSENLRLIG